MCFPCFRRRLGDLQSALREIEAIFQPEKANIGVGSIHTSMKTLMMISFRMMMVVMMVIMVMMNIKDKRNTLTMVAAIMGFSTSSKYDEGGGGGVCFAKILGGGTKFGQ